jgi:hypothetical protein
MEIVATVVLDNDAINNVRDVIDVIEEGLIRGYSSGDERVDGRDGGHFIDANGNVVGKWDVVPTAHVHAGQDDEFQVKMSSGYVVHVVEQDVDWGAGLSLVGSDGYSNQSLLEFDAATARALGEALIRKADQVDARAAEDEARLARIKAAPAPKESMF